MVSEPNEWPSEIFFALASSSAVTPCLLQLGDHLEDQPLRLDPMFRFERRVDPEQPRIAGRVGKGRDPENETCFLPHPAIESRAAAIAENGRKQIERRDIGMGNLRDVPGQREPCQLRGKLFVDLPPSLLRRLLRDVARRERPRWIAGKIFFELCVNLARIDVADDDEREIVRHVARLVILQHVLLRELVEDLNLADHRKAIGMPLIGGFEQELPHHPIGIVIEHGELSPDDFLFLAVFLRRKGGVHHRVGQNIERARDPFLAARRSKKQSDRRRYRR